MPAGWGSFSKNWKQNHGFSLLEIMVSISIVAIVFVAIYEMQFPTLALTLHTHFSTAAPVLAQRKMAQLEQSGLKDLTETAGDFEKIHPGYRWKVVVENVNSDILGRASKDLKKIDLTIFHPDEKSSFSIRTYRYIR